LDLDDAEWDGGFDAALTSRRLMTEFGSWSLATAVACAAVVFASSCGDSSCKELRRLCGQCPNEESCKYCRSTVEKGEPDACSAELPMYEQYCVLPYRNCDDSPVTTTTHTTSKNEGGATGEGGTTAADGR
jgi:hypothetical protein